jgi:hypothetical protein
MRSTSFLTAAFFPLGFALPEDHATTSGSSGTGPSTGTTSPCYKLDGSEASDHVPCGTGDSVNCCHEDDICLSNGLCYQQGDRGMSLSRGSCSDREWGEGCYAPCCMLPCASILPPLRERPVTKCVPIVQPSIIATPELLL